MRHAERFASSGLGYACDWTPKNQPEAALTA
jgi:hypothetical protein